MKKVLFIFGIVFVFSACTDCQDCTFESENTSTEVCRNDYDSNADYQAALLALEELGADCK